MRILIYILNISFWSFFILTSLVFFAGALIIRLVSIPFDPNRKFLQQYSCFWASLYVWTNPFWTVQVSGRENLVRGNPYVMVSNHKSIVDILVIFRTFLHFKWVSKASMFKVPLLGWNMRLNGYIAIRRGDPHSREKCLARCREWLGLGSSVFFFPEGTRSKDGKMGSFKPGAFRIAIETGRDILPMAIHGSEHAVPKHSILLTEKSKMSVKILPPIKVSGFDRTKLEQESLRLSEMVYQVIQTALQEMGASNRSAA